ncbi:Hypothetical protein PHPALM_37606 [Phytophthora palmivora]|uniref:Uncharacterized protein n=1 Tax=Phytophthora palmivora TaxID=4796 RepID=A0A2P4WX02_9STRA|nr:Hypothetical protein PHPALM_37606 [Phytophthora palmivora]
MAARLSIFQYRKNKNLNENTESSKLRICLPHGTNSTLGNLPCGTQAIASRSRSFRHVVAFMKLSLPQVFALNDQVLDAGSRAEDAVLAFLQARGTNAKGTGSVVRALKPLYKSEAFGERIYAYKRLLTIVRIEAPHLSTHKTYLP